MVRTDFILWGYQPHFRVIANSRAARLFDELDPVLNSEIFLVGLRRDAQAEPVVFVEADEPDQFVHLLDGLPRTLEDIMFAHRAETANQFIAGPPGVAERHEARVPLRLAAHAVRQHLEKSTLGIEKRFWVGFAHLIREYYVVPVLALAKSVVDRHACLTRSVTNLGTINVSLIDAAADELIKRCSRSLRLPNAGEDIDGDFDFGDEDYILRRAASSVMLAPVVAGRTIEGLHGLFTACDALSAEPYERSEARATLFVCAKDHPCIDLAVRMAEPVGLRNARAARKLLQMSHSGLAMVSDGTSMLGLGRLSGTYDPAREDLFEVRFIGRLRWELRHGGRVLFQVKNRRPSLPNSPLERAQFCAFVRRMCPQATDADTSRLWKCVAPLLSAQHGTTLVVAANAADEARRLASQGTPITPTVLDDNVMQAVTRIDGAVLLDVSGVCHSIGVILDGVATPHGRRSRGSRFNSALRYVTTHPGTVAVVISDDGSVDLLPDLPPRIRRSTLTAALDALRAIAEGTQSYDRLGKVMSALYDLQFYLFPADCGEANRLRAAIEAAHPLGAYELRIVYQDFIPNPAMNDSYFEEEPPAG